MKKFLSVIIAAVFLLALVACDNDDAERKDGEGTTGAAVSIGDPVKTEKTDKTDETTAAVDKKPQSELLVTLLQNELYGLGVNNGAYIPEINVYNDRTFKFYCNLYYGIITYAGKWEKQSAGGEDKYSFTVENQIPAEGGPIAVTSADLPVPVFSLTHKSGQCIMQFNIGANAYFGMTENDAYFDIIDGDLLATVSTQKMTNGEVMGIFASKFEQNNGTIYSYADITHDGYLDMFAVKQDDNACKSEVYTLDNGEPKLIHTGYSANTTNGLCYYNLYTEDGFEYIIRAGFYYRQGVPLFYYNIFSLDANGNEIMFAKNVYDAAESRLENEEEILEEIEHEFDVYCAYSDCPIIDIDDTNIYPSGWSYSKFMKYPEIFEGARQLRHPDALRVGKYSYTVADGKATLVAYNTAGITDETDAVVPLEIDGHPVVAITKDVFVGQYSLESVEIRENVISIEEGSFDGCNHLKYIKCPASTAAEAYAIAHGIEVKYIERLSPYDKPDAENPADVAKKVTDWDDVKIEKEILCGDYMIGIVNGEVIILDYYGMVKYNKVKDIVVPDTFEGCPVRAIGEEAFEDQEYIKSIKLPEGIEYIGEGAFNSCYRAESINIPDSVIHIDKLAFYRCESLKSIVIPDSVKIVGSHAFSFCDNVESLVISDGVEVIGDNAFSGLGKLTSVEIPKSVKTIGEYAFSACGFSEFHMPSSVMEIGKYALSECGNLKRITVDEKNKYYTADENGVLYNKDMTKLVAFPSQLVSYTVPESVTEIPEGFFMSATALKSVVLHAGIVSIGDYAFRSCGELTEVTVYGNPAVGNQLFNSCAKLAAVKCAAGTYIESQAKAKGINVEYIK